MISQNTIQQIQSRIDITEIVGGFVKLKKRGANYLGLCPFHNEKTPSFTVSPSKEIYKCFGCGKSGNTISFLMDHEKYSYVEALRWLANKYNVEIEETESTPEQKLQQQAADSLYILNNFAQKYFTEQLFKSEEGHDVALSYLHERGFRNDIIEKFQLGYSLNQWEAFSAAAKSAQFNSELLVKSGLSIARENKLLDNYRGRIIFPVHNQTGKIIGFGARIIGKNDKAPKYINTPENEIYVKSKIVYGAYFARQAIDKNDECLLVEGYTDVISLHQAGIENVVASGGTSLTTDQLRLIKKYTNNLTIIYDGDPAGVKAALRGLDMAIEESLNVKLVLIPDKEDPDSYVNKVGPTAFRDFIASNKKDFILFRLEVALKDAGSDTNRKAEVVNQIAETIAKINKAEDFTRQQDYIRQCAAIMKIEEAGLTALVNKFIREQVTRMESRSAVDNKQVFDENSKRAQDANYSDEIFEILHHDELQERALIKTLVEHGTEHWDETTMLAAHIFSEMNEFSLIEKDELKTVLDAYKKMFDSGRPPAITDFVYSPNQVVSATVISITNFPYELSKHWDLEGNTTGILKDDILKTPDYQSFMKSILLESGDINSEIFKSEKDDLEKKEVISNLRYLKLKKIRSLVHQNLSDLQKAQTDEEKKLIQQTHQHLKELQMQIIKEGDTVYLGQFFG
jgi:DNA primase